MTDGIKDVVAQLEQQKAAIDRALEALRGIESGDGHQADVEITEEGESPKRGRPAKRKGGMTPEGKKRLIAALKRRWAAKKAAQGGPVEAAAVAPATKKRGISAAGRKRLAEAMKRRWAVKRAGSAVKKSGRGKRAKAAA